MRKRKPSFGVAALAVFVTFGCGSGESSGDAAWGGAVRDSAGIAIVENPETGLWADAEAWRFEETLRIGVADGDPAYQLGQVVDLTVDEGGSIYVVDGQTQSVRVYDAEGGHVTDIAGPGGGPGELGPSLPAVMLGPGDTLMVADVANQKVQRFLRDGTEAGSFAVSFEDGVPLRWVESPDGGVAYQTRRIALPGSPAAAGDAGGGDPVILRDADGTVRNTLVTLAEGESMQFSGGQPRFRLLGAEPVWTILSDGRLVTGISDEYRLDIRVPDDGRIDRIVSKPFEPDPVTAADRDRLRSFLRDLMEDQGTPPQAIDMMLQSVEFADEHPAFVNVTGGPDGTIWVQRPIRTEELDPDALAVTELEDLTGSREWEVFAGDGRFMGTVTFPPRFRPLRWRGDDVYGVRRDDLDVPYVVRLRLVRPGDGA